MALERCRFDVLFVLGGVPSHIVAAAAPVAGSDVRILDRQSVTPDRHGRVPVTAIIRAVRRIETRARRVLVLSAPDIAAPACASLFGFADRRRAVAVVSVARLDASAAIATESRVLNAIAHEAGHLDGLRHCPRAGCVMGRVITAADIDGRSGTACGGCPRTGQFRRRLLASAALFGVLAAGVMTIEAVATAVFGRGIELPFACRAVDADGNHDHVGAGIDDRAVFHFNGEPLFTIHDRNGHAGILDRSRPMTHRLNEVWMSGAPIVVRAHAAERAIDLNGVRFVRVLAEDTQGRPAADVLDEWTQAVANVFRRQGRAVAIERAR